MCLQWHISKGYFCPRSLEILDRTCCHIPPSIRFIFSTRILCRGVSDCMTVSLWCLLQWINQMPHVCCPTFRQIYSKWLGLYIWQSGKLFISIMFIYTVSVYWCFYILLIYCYILLMFTDIMLLKYYSLYSNFLNSSSFVIRILYFHFP